MMRIRSFIHSTLGSVRLAVSTHTLYVEHIESDGTTGLVDTYKASEMTEVVTQLKTAGYQESSDYSTNVASVVRPLAGAELDLACEITPSDILEINAELIPDLREFLNAYHQTTT